MSDDRDRIAQLLTQRSPPQRSPYARPGAPSTHNTQLPPLDEMAFRQWVTRNRVPFDPDRPVTDYDMRGFYRGLQQQHPRATQGINPGDQQMHYSDYWKTPMHPTFSAESQWAGPIAPRWNEQDQLISPGLRILADEGVR